MSVLQFVASLAGSLAWPALVLSLALIFRRPLLALLETVRQFEGWGLKASFGKDVERLAEDARAAPVPLPGPGVNQRAHKAVPQSTAAPPPAGVSYGGVLTPSPAQTVLRGWAEITRAIFQASKLQGFPAVGDAGQVEMLVAMGKISPETQALIDEARRLRNSVVHAPATSPSLSTAALYYSSARDIAKRILREAGVSQPGE